ncbi:MAG: ABC transporter ATP-binding protein, partial [Alphaproteobacteria bacterium]
MAPNRSWFKPADDGSLALMKRLFSETGREFAPRYAYIIGLNLIVAGTTALYAWMIRDVVNEIFFEKNERMLYVLIAALMIIGVVRGFAIYVSTVNLGKIGNAIIARVQNRLFDHMLNLGVDFYNRTSAGELVTRISHNATAAREVLDLMVTSVGRDVLSIIALVIVMFVQSPLMSLIVLVIGPIAILGITKLVRRVRGVARAQFTSLSMVISAMQETARGIRVIKAFNLEPIMRKRMGHSIDEVRQRADKIVRIGARASPLMEIMGGVAIACVVFLSGYQIIYMGVNPGELMSFVVAVVLAYEPAKRLARMQITLEAGLVGVRLMYELLDLEPAIRQPADAPGLVVGRGTVVFHEVDFGYESGTALFSQFDFTAEGGQVTALVGPSGSGKTTIISLIERFFNVAGGHITIDGQDIATLDTMSLRDQVALVSQDIILFRDTIRENIRLGRPSASDAEVEQAARDAMAYDFIMASQDGFDTELNDSAAILSGGQRQRLAIARAMLRDAPIILLDEATSSLDTESEHQVQLAFDRLMQGRTTIVIAHRLSTVQGADKICVLVEGSIVEEGRHQDLL